MSDNGFCRTAGATPGLLNICQQRQVEDFNLNSYFFFKENNKKKVFFSSFFCLFQNINKYLCFFCVLSSVKGRNTLGETLTRPLSNCSDIHTGEWGQEQQSLGGFRPAGQLPLPLDTSSPAGQGRADKLTVTASDQHQYLGQFH